MITVLSTKKLTETQKSLFDNHTLVIVDTNFIKTKSIAFEVSVLNEILIFTSKNAVKSVLKNRNLISIQSKKCICVGEKTKKYLEKKGFVVLDYKENATTLAECIVSNYHSNSFTFFSGTIRKESLPMILNENKIIWNETVVYETLLNPKKIRVKTDVILFFSPSGIESYLLKNEIENKMCFCIGKTTAKALENKTKKIKIAAQPSVESVIESAISHMLNA